MEELKRVERGLKQIVQDLIPRINPRILEAIEYSLFPAGKRIRPLLCIQAYESVGGKGDVIIPYACCLELIHTASLIKDDLPCMDNHSTRRDKPTTWKVFGESTAMLAADLISSEAYRILSTAPNRAILTEILNTVLNMSNGQELDVRGIKSTEVNRLKTATLFETCFAIGGMVAGATPEQLSDLRNKGLSFGMDFQLKDDTMDKDGLYAVSAGSLVA